ncbi:MAG: phosphatase PAP2 family protein [Actinobacteria bacterium]|nr:phosphatase PAP2 family protein [Actinomycetota bacterium]
MRGEGHALKATGQLAAKPLLPTAARPLAVAIVVVCVLVIAVQGVWLRHGMETGSVDATVDAKVLTSLGGHPGLLAALVWPGEPMPVIAMAAALVLACILRRRYSEAALVAISAPLAQALTELVLKPLIGRTSWGDPFPSGHVTSVVALATAVTLLLARMPARIPRLLRSVLAVTAFLIAAAVAFGVIGAHMHHFVDTVGGAAVGIGTVLLTAFLLDLVIARLNARASRMPAADG